MNEDIRTRIALSLVPNIGANRAKHLLERVDKPSDIFKLSEPDLLKISGFGPKIVRNLKSFDGWNRVNDVIRKTEKLACRLIIPEDSSYPVLLKEIPDPPLILWVRGDVELLNSAGIAIIGTRSPSLYGKTITQEFVKNLVGRNLSIISGFAYGIDTIAHKSTISSGGKTIAVLGSGIDRVYPQSNDRLYDEILEKGGAIISEFPPGTKPDYMNFPTRNRVVSGLCLGVLVVETGVEGGSMITARLALEQNREVFIIPHNLHNERAQGCHKLIRESSGKLVENVDDILSEFQWAAPAMERDKKMKEPAEPENLTSISSKCWNFISMKPNCHLDEICTSLGLDTSMIVSSLLDLEFAGHIRQRPGKRFELNVL